jgi:adenylate kinase family enzyme
MQVYALVGSSGTGKSYKAFMVAAERGIDFIIDDGLLIGGTRVYAGTSAKRERTKIASVKRALFKEENHREAVKKILEEQQPEKILILGTSLKMIQEIRCSLGLPELEQIIPIETVSTDKEIEIARKSRKEEGKHVIPVPALEIKKDFSGYFIDSLKIFRRKGKNTQIEEKTIIRPSFSYMGKYEVAKTVLVQMIHIRAESMERVGKVIKVKIDNKPTGIHIHMDVTAKLATRIDLLMGELQKKIIEDIEYMTGINVISVDITVRGIVR